MSIRMICFDLDGTMLNSDKELTERASAALFRAAKKGIEIVPTTGRFYEAMPEAVRALPFVRYALTVNGASVYDTAAKKSIRDHLIAPERAAEVMRFLDGYPVVYDCFMDHWGYMSRRLRDRAEEFAPNVHYVKMIRGLRMPVDDLQQFVTERGTGVQKVQLFAKDMDLRENLLRILPEAFPDLNVTSSVVNNIEINAKDASKGQAMKELAAYLGMDMKDVAVLGDGLNDVTMFEEAGLRIAMGNSCPEVLALADHVTDDCDHEGAAKGIEQWVLGEDSTHDQKEDPMDKTFNWCFIGSGKLAHIVAELITASGRHRITSVYTRNTEKGQAFAAQFGAEAFASPEAALTAPGVDAVYVVTPHSSHHEYAKLALEHGKPVLCEKAMTVRAEETEELFALAKEKGVYLSEAMWTWYAPVANRVKTWIDKGLFGEILTCHVDMCLAAANYAPRVTDPMAAGGALLDLGVYAVTYIYRLFGMPEEIACSGTVRDGIDIDDRITMTYPGGKEYTAALDIYGQPGGGFVRIEGTEASLYLPHYHHADEAVLRLKDGEEIRFEGDGGYLHEFDTVAAEIRAGKTESAFVAPKHTTDVMRLLDQCRAQIGLKYPFEP